MYICVFAAITLQRDFIMSTNNNASVFAPTIRGYVHVYNKPTRKTQLLSPVPTAMLAEQQSSFEGSTGVSRAMPKARDAIEAMFH